MAGPAPTPCHRLRGGPWGGRAGRAQPEARACQRTRLSWRLHPEQRWQPWRRPATASAGTRCCAPGGGADRGRGGGIGGQHKGQQASHLNSCFLLGDKSEDACLSAATTPLPRPHCPIV